MFLSGFLVGMLATYAASGLIGLLVASKMKDFQVRE